VARLTLASVLAGQGNTAEAVTQLQETVRVRPNLALAHAELGQLLARRGQSDPALQELETAVRLNPTADSYFSLGSVLGTLGRATEAASAFSQEIQLDPENSDARYNYAIALAEGGNLDQAVGQLA
jgi:tetratricopeptide (TPR) repeat protein